MIRRALSWVTRTDSRDECATSRYREYQELVAQWRSARTNGERDYYEREMSGVAWAIRDRGQVPPVPPRNDGQPAVPPRGAVSPPSSTAPTVAPLRCRTDRPRGTR
ncbi:hypothetical protein ACFQX6_27105 [Streptosporangium lutulentum]